MIVKTHIERKEKNKKKASLHQNGWSSIGAGGKDEADTEK